MMTKIVGDAEHVLGWVSWNFASFYEKRLNMPVRKQFGLF
jgi:hypothetical protein